MFYTFKLNGHVMNFNRLVSLTEISIIWKCPVYCTLVLDNVVSTLFIFSSDIVGITRRNIYPSGSSRTLHAIFADEDILE